MSDRLVSAKTSATITAKDDGQALTYESIVESFVRQKSFKCHYDGCDKSFPTHRGLDSHIRRRHAVDGNTQSGEPIGSSSSVCLNSLFTTNTASNAHSSATSSQTPVNGHQVSQTLPDPRLRKRSTDAPDNCPINTSHASTSGYIPSGQLLAAKAGASSHSTPNTCRMSTTQTNGYKRCRTGGAPALAVNSTIGGQSSAGKGSRKAEVKQRRLRSRRSRKRRKHNTNADHELVILSTDEDTNSDSDVEIIADDSPCVTSTVPPPPTSAATTSMAITADSESDSDIEIVAETIAQPTGVAPIDRQSSESPPLEAVVVPNGLANGLWQLHRLPPIATAVDTAIRALAMAHIVPNRVRRLSGASADTSPTITPVHSDMEISDIDDSDLLDPPDGGGADPPADDPLPDEEFYKNFDSLVDRVSDLIGANTASAADDHDVKPLIAAEDHTVIALDIKPDVKPDNKLDIKSDIKPDIKPIADNSAPDMTSNNAGSAPGDSVSHIAGQRVIKQLNNDMSDETLIDVKPLLIDPSLHTVSDQSLATTLSTQTEETASVEPIVAQIPPLIVNNNTNANRDEQSCVGTTLIGAVISDTDSQTIATTNHKKSVTNTIEEVIVRQEMGVNSGQEFSAHLTAPVDNTDQSFSSISSTDSNPTPNSGRKNSGKKVAEESVPATIGPQRERHLTLEYYRRRKKRLREAFRAKRGVDFTDSDIDSDSDDNSDQSLTPFDGLLRDVSKRMASKTTSPLKTVGRSPPTASTSTATDTTRRSRSLTSRDGSAHSASSQLPEPLPTVSSTSERRTRRGRSSTLSDGELIDDETVADSEREYECRECRQPFGHNRYEYNEHQYVIHGERHPYRCDYDDPRRPLDKRCGKQYDRAFDYVHHQRRQHDLRVRYECEYSGCDQYFDHRSAIKEHIREAHGKQLPFVCDRADCGQSFGCETQLYAHKRDDHYHVRNGRQKADSLEVTVPLAFRGSRSAPDGHNEDKHSGDYYKCDAKECGRSFVTKKLLNLHKLRLHSEPIVDQSVPKPTLKICQYECDYKDCFGMFATEEILQKHKLAVHQKHDQLATSAPELPTVSIDTTISVTTTRSQLTTGGVTLTDSKISETVPALDTTNDIRVPENTTGTFLNDWPVLTATDPLPVQPVTTTASTGPSMTTTDCTDRSPHTTPAFKCDKCPKRFHWERNLKQHKLTVHRRAPDTSATRSLAAPIVPKTSTRSPFTSLVPKASTSAATSASEPTTAAANSTAPVAAKPVFRCDKCAKRFRYEYNLIQHKLSAHSLALPYRCRYRDCDNAYGTKYLLHLHLIEHRIDSRTLNSRLKISTRTARRSPATSTVPKASTGTAATATDTVSITTPTTAATDSTTPVAAKPVFRCDKCTKTFRYEYNLKHHKLYAHCDQPLTYRCRYDGCANIFATKYLLNLHLIEFKSHRIAGHTDSSLNVSTGTTSRSQTTSAVSTTDTKATNHCLPLTYRCRYEGCANPYASKALLERHLRLFESHRIDSRTLNSQSSVANTYRDGRRRPTRRGRRAILPRPESAGKPTESRTVDSKPIAGSTSRSGHSPPPDECDGELIQCRDCDARFLTLRALTAHKCAPLFGAPACDVDLRDPSVQHCDRDYRERLHLNYPCDYDGCRTEFSSLSLLNAHKQEFHWT